MDFLEMLNNFFTKFDNILWGVPMIVILLGAHIYMTVRTKFVQRKTFKAIKLSVTKDPDSDGDISPFQALTTALASTIGTGNIIGVGTAIALGGAGAVLWCWISGVFFFHRKSVKSSCLAPKANIKFFGVEYNSVHIRYYTLNFHRSHLFFICILDINIPAQINTTDIIVSMPKTLSPSIMPESRVPNTGTSKLKTQILLAG
jgi:hypothetical protein